MSNGVEEQADAEQVQTLHDKMVVLLGNYVGAAGWPAMLHRLQAVAEQRGEDKVQGILIAAEQFMAEEES